MVEHREMWVDYDICWRIGEPVSWLGRAARIVAGGNVPYRVLVEAGWPEPVSVRLDELRAAV